MIKKSMSKTSVENEEAMTGLICRLLPTHAHAFRCESLKADTDVFELESVDGQTVIRGNTANSMAVGLNHYLKYYCRTSVSWNVDNPREVPEVLPAVPERVRKAARCQDRFFLNYCTFGYSMPWWQWREWEHFVDWMALNGVTMPLAITGQEAVWYRVWKEFGLSDTEIREYFTGPAHLAWHRMANLDYWQGPLPEGWLDHQVELQKKIVERERALNMTPVLPAFAGHVPAVLKEHCPDANIKFLGKWGGFDARYRSSFLDPLDPLFMTIQDSFLKKQTALFGTDHIYGTDPFNEVEPPSWDPEYLAQVGRTTFESMTRVDPEAHWLQMTWVFYFDRKHWTNERIEAMVTSVPRDRMILLDYYCENKEVWRMTDAFFGQPFLWCYLGNFGGNTMLAGNLEVVEERIENTFKEVGDRLWGMGTTLEALDYNLMMYEYVFEKAWSDGPTNTKEWIQSYSASRCGLEDDNAAAAWKLLHEHVYTRPAMCGQGTLTNARPTLTKHGSWATKDTINYENRDLLTAWERLLAGKARSRNSYCHDVVNIGRQVLGNHFRILRDQFTRAYHEKAYAEAETTGLAMLDLLDDMDRLLHTHADFLLGRWIAGAKAMAVSSEEEAYYEVNARTILTTWGEQGQDLTDYANRSWAGLTRGYYRTRWQMFICDVLACLRKDVAFDEALFGEKVAAFEWLWTQQHDDYSGEVIGDAVEIAEALVRKYGDAIRQAPKVES